MRRTPEPAQIPGAAALCAVAFACGCVHAPESARLGDVAAIEAVEPASHAPALDSAPSIDGPARDHWPVVVFLVPNDLRFRTTSFGAPRLAGAARTGATPEQRIGAPESRGAGGEAFDALVEPFAAALGLPLIALRELLPDFGGAGATAEDGGAEAEGGEPEAGSS